MSDEWVVVAGFIYVGLLLAYIKHCLDKDDTQK